MTSNIKKIITELYLELKLLGYDVHPKKIRRLISVSPEGDYKMIRLVSLLYEYPNFIWPLKSLRHFEAIHANGRGSNMLTSIPQNIGGLQDLKTLFVSLNKISSLPESIGNLKNLNYLDLSKNQLKSLPESIGKLKNLKELRVDKNPLESLPESIKDLENLEFFELREHNLTSLPSNAKCIQFYRKHNIQNWEKLINKEQPES